MQFDGVLGDTILVNGTVAPYLDVTTERVRLRLLNGSSARMYDFAFADGRDVRPDRRPTAACSKHRCTATDIPLSPGERAEIVVSMEPGSASRCGLQAPDPALNAGSAGFDVMELRAAASLAASPEVPSRLAEPAHRRCERRSGGA